MPTSISKSLSRTDTCCDLLVIDDDLSVKLLVERALDGLCGEIKAAASAQDGLDQLEKNLPDIVILDNILPDSQGIEVLKKIHDLDHSLPVIFITARGTGATAIEAMKHSAFDYLPKPLEFSKLREQVKRAIELKSMLAQSSPKPESPAIPAIGAPTYLVGESPGMQEVFKAIGKSSMLEVPIIIRGEHGTGKESVARTIHQHSRYHEGPFIQLHCPAFDEARFEAELFGVVDPEGKLTQAGKIQNARNGVLLLQEIGNLPLSSQSKMLRVLREGAYEAIGSKVTQPLQCRILATSSQDLEALVREGRLRADLYYLLSAFVISIPPLRQRRSDLPLLIDHLLKHMSYKKEGSAPMISQQALERLCQHTWPGNIDELHSVLKRSVIESKGNVILSDSLVNSLNRDPVKEDSQSKEQSGMTDWSLFVDLRVDAGATEIYSEAVAEMERKLLSRLLQHTSGNQAQAAKMLGITRTSLRKKLRQLSINVQQVVQMEEETIAHSISSSSSEE